VPLGACTNSRVENTATRCFWLTWQPEREELSLCH
jgi:hypothetical protein